MNFAVPGSDMMSKGILPIQKQISLNNGATEEKG